MKIFDFDAFVKLPNGVIFSYYQPCVARGLYRREDVLPGDDGTPHDFFQTELMPQCFDLPDGPWETGVTDRWGLFDYDAQFCVYEAADLAALRELLAGAVPA